MIGNEAAARPAVGLRAVVTGISNEVYKGLLFGWSERVQIAIELPLFIAFFLLFAVLTGRGEEVVATGEILWSLEPQRTSWLFVGFTAFALFYLQSVKLFWRLLGEIQSGTLEQVHLSPLPSWLVVAAGRVVAALIETVVVVSMMFAITNLFADLDVPWRVEATVPLLFLIAASIGYSLVLGGLTLILKRVEILSDLMLVPVWVASGMFIPLAAMPTWLATFGRVMPITHPLHSLRQVLFEAGSFDVAWGDGGLVWVAVSALGWLLVGILMFGIGERVARQQGSLAHS